MDLSDDEFIITVFRDVLSVDRIFIFWVVVDFDTDDMFRQKSVVIEYGCLVEFIA